MAQTISPICTLSVLVAHNSNVLLIYYPEDTVLPLPLLLENTAHTFEILWQPKHVILKVVTFAKKR